MIKFVQNGEDIPVSGTRVVDAEGFVVSETGSCVAGFVAWLKRQHERMLGWP